MSVPAAEHTPAYGGVDLTTCDREPIHVPGAIQPHGVLLAVDQVPRADGPDGPGTALAAARVVMVSANVDDALGVAPQDAVGRELADLVGRATAERIELHRADTPLEPLVLTIEQTGPGGTMRGVALDVAVHTSGTRTVIELEPYDPVSAAQMTYQSARGAMARLGAETTIAGLGAQLVREVRSLIGFDRVMLYRFDRQWNGEVIAEDKRDDLNSFFGLHYPATDIPAQARRLYTVNWTRLIVDIHYRPVPLHPVLDPGTGAPLDLSHSTLRSVSPIHVEYLSHMDVTASMSISLLVGDQLWGLLACHHYSGPHRPAHEARAAAQFLAQHASQLVAERERAEVRDAKLESQRLITGLTSRASGRSQDPVMALMSTPDVLELVGATGAALYREGSITTIGEVPDDRYLHVIANTLHRDEPTPAFHDRLQDLDPRLADVADVAAGAICLSTTTDLWLMWLRPEQEKVVDWGGDPTNKLLAAQEGGHVRLSPRRSFAKWRQVVRGTSMPWEPWQVEAVDALNRHVTELVLQHSREQIAMAESVQRSVVAVTPPTFAGLQVAARYQPASTYQLGGDWWDAFPLDDGRVALVVGDVAGHGVSAATAMTQVRTALRAYLFTERDPARCLDRLDTLMDGLLDQRIATAVVAIADPAAGTVDLAAAGHPSPLLATRDGVEEVALRARPLLGLGEGSATTSRLTCGPDDTLLLYTDGLVERRGVDLSANVELLRRCEGPGAGAAGLEAWIDRLLTQVPGVRDDDTTLLALRLAP